MSKLRLIQCGVGGFGSLWIKEHTSKSPDFDLVAIVDVSDKELHGSGDAVNFPKEKRFKSLEEALDKFEADAVLTATPPVVHLEHAKLAFARGLHFMTEKPIADTLENAKEMVDLAKQAGKQIVVSQNYRYNPQVMKLKELVAKQTAGEFGHGHLDFYIPGDFTGTFRETMDYPLLVDMAIHHLDLVRYITGRNIERVTAMSFRPNWSWFRHEPGLKMLMELGPLEHEPISHRIPFSYSGDWSARGQVTTWNGTWRVQCAEGSIHWDPNGIAIHRCEKWMKNPTSEVIEAGTLERQGQAATLHNFAEAIRSGKPAETSGEDNLWSFGAVTAGVISAKEKRPVEVAEILGR
jgi:predicted dehydrogenase